LFAVDADDWASKLEVKGLSVVDAHNTWCGPCLAVQPMFKRLLLAAQQANADLSYFSVDANKIEELKKHNIGAEPFFLFYMDGKLRESITGVDFPRILRTIGKYVPQEVVNSFQYVLEPPKAEVEIQVSAPDKQPQNVAASSADADGGDEAEPERGEKVPAIKSDTLNATTTGTSLATAARTKSPRGSPRSNPVGSPRPIVKNSSLTTLDRSRQVAGTSTYIFVPPSEKESPKRPSLQKQTSSSSMKKLSPSESAENLIAPHNT